VGVAGSSRRGASLLYKKDRAGPLDRLRLVRDDLLIRLVHPGAVAIGFGVVERDEAAWQHQREERNEILRHAILVVSSVDEQELQLDPLSLQPAGARERV